MNWKYLKLVKDELCHHATELIKTDHELVIGDSQSDICIFISQPIHYPKPDRVADRFVWDGVLTVLHLTVSWIRHTATWGTTAADVQVTIKVPSSNLQQTLLIQQSIIKHKCGLVSQSTKHSLQAFAGVSGTLIIHRTILQLSIEVNPKKLWMAYRTSCSWVQWLDCTTYEQ